MLKKYKWILLLIFIPVLLFASLQVPWNSSVERAILSQFDFDATSVPRRASGRIDFARILDDAAYLAPEDNCVVDVARLFGMDMEPPPDRIMQALGNPQILPAAERIPEIDVYYRRVNPEATDDQLQEIYDIYERPWTGDHFPEGEQWIQEYNDLIDGLHRASKKKGYYHPYRDDGDGLLVGVLLPCVQRMRSASRVLCARAMYHLGNGNSEAAMNDLIANKDLAVKLNAAPLLVEQLVGVAMHGIGHQGVCELLGQELSKGQLQQLHREFSADQLQSISRETSRNEKLFALELIEMAAKGGFGSDDVGMRLDPRLQFLLNIHGAVDWEVAAELFNDFHDKIGTAAEIEDEMERIRQMKLVMGEIDRARAELDGSGIILRMLAGAKSRGMIAGQLLMELMVPGIDSVGAALTRQKIQSDLVGVAAAIELFRLRNHNYPDDLEELIPEFLEQVPIDRFNGGPINFVLTDTHYFIASAGPDGKDDLATLISLEDSADEYQYDDSRSWVRVKRK